MKGQVTGMSLLAIAPMPSHWGPDPEQPPAPAQDQSGSPRQLLQRPTTAAGRAFRSGSRRDELGRSTGEQAWRASGKDRRPDDTQQLSLEP